MTEFLGKSLTTDVHIIPPANSWCSGRFLKRKEAFFSLAHKESIPFKIPFPSEDNHQIKEKQ